MKEWTDVDYAQAAIDMLPETVEEIGPFLKSQKVKIKPAHPWSRQCPIALWIQRWTNTDVVDVGFTYAKVNGAHVQVPDAVTTYVHDVDRKAWG